MDHGAAAETSKPAIRALPTLMLVLYPLGRRTDSIRSLMRLKNTAPLTLTGPRQAAPSSVLVPRSSRRSGFPPEVLYRFFMDGNRDFWAMVRWTSQASSGEYRMPAMGLTAVSLSPKSLSR